MQIEKIKKLLDQAVKRYNVKGFIKNDPISIPHRYTKKEDIEITAFWTAMLSWGLRKTIINKCNELFGLMDNAPHDFMLNHEDSDLKKLLDFKHRTFNTTDTLYFIAFFKWFYSNHKSLEDAFLKNYKQEDAHVGNALIGFHNLFFSLEDAPGRTKKHVATPERKSTCKRINMFLRWMVRKDDKGVDFGIWKNIRTDQLLCPLDVHVERVGRKLGLIQRKQRDWQTTIELTENLKQFNADDPVIYDYALFGLGVEEKF